MEEILLQEEQASEEVVEQKVGFFYLRFADEASFLACCEEAGFMREEVVEWETVTETVFLTNENGEEVQESVEKKVPKEIKKHLVTCSHGHFIDVIGSLSKGGSWQLNEQTGETEILEEPIVVEGYHVNYSGILPASFEVSLIDAPSTPHRTMLM